MNKSPWLTQLKNLRPKDILEENLVSDITIIGGGISGISTAYYILKNTNKKVLLLEAGEIANGATGHNAGQISSYFEKMYLEIKKEFGEELTLNALEILEVYSRGLLDDIFTETKIDIVKEEFIGFRAVCSLDFLLNSLEEFKDKKNSHQNIYPILIFKEWFKENENKIDKKYQGLYELVSQKDILEKIEVKDNKYFSAIPFLSGTMNSALFCEELVGFLIKKYQDRFILKEHSPVSKIILDKEDCVIYAGINDVVSKKVILCTNGYKFLNIVDKNNLDINQKYHIDVKGLVGYMKGYKLPLKNSSFASTFENLKGDDQYYYITRRPFSENFKEKYNLFCLGGPQIFFPDNANYSKEMNFSIDINDVLDNFIIQNFKINQEALFKWHGLMGYTENGIRKIGEDKSNKNLLYNIGCNGVGILLSIYGGERISKILNGEILNKTIFDKR